MYDKKLLTNLSVQALIEVYLINTDRHSCFPRRVLGAYVMFSTTIVDIYAHISVAQRSTTKLTSSSVLFYFVLFYFCLGGESKLNVCSPVFLLAKVSSGILKSLAHTSFSL